MFRLGNIFFWGKGTEPDSAQALRLFQQATQKAWGHLQFDAINNLGLMYEQGKGVKADQARIGHLIDQLSEAERKASELVAPNELWNLYEREGASNLNAGTGADLTQPGTGTSSRYLGRITTVGLGASALF